jgi:hypothetical protein
MAARQFSADRDTKATPHETLAQENARIALVSTMRTGFDGYLSSAFTPALASANATTMPPKVKRHRLQPSGAGCGDILSQAPASCAELFGATAECAILPVAIEISRAHRSLRRQHT